MIQILTIGKKNLVISALLIAVIGFGACSDPGPARTGKAEIIADKAGELPADSSKSRAFQLDIIETIPQGMDGCGDYYAYDSTGSNTGKYVFLSDLGERAVVSINGTLFYLAADTASSKSTEGRILERFVGDELEVIQDLTLYNSYEEGGFYSGTLTVVYMSQQEVFNVHGQTGC